MKAIRCIRVYALTALSIVVPIAYGQAPQAGQDGVEHVIVNNTLVVVNRFGPSFIRFHADGTFQSLRPDGKVTAEGTWRTSDDQVCSIVTRNVPPGRVPKEHCLDLKGRSVGDSWQGEVDPRNGQLFFKLVTGHPELSAIPR